jgi:tetratricopeptide (TPR) repeat protein
LTYGSFCPAEAAYKEAASLAPKDPAPLSNLSSVYFELGKYAEAAKYARDSLELTEESGLGGEAAGRKTKTLLTRLAKSYLHGSQIVEAEQLIDQVSVAELTNSLRATTEALNAWKASASLETARSLVFDRLPRFKPYLYANFVTGVPGKRSTDFCLD